ncbi:MAG: hypothetical protein KDN20_25890 [Verrucomicrobiae bacterium]|nr:hypothetical protein [Verrucomicrobiae bacterium]
MKDLSRLLECPFDQRGISVAELLAFVTDHLGRMKVRNPDGKLDSRIAATESALSAFKDSDLNDLTGFAHRKVSKMTKTRFRLDLPRRVAQIYVHLAVLHGKRSTEMIQYGPRNVYRRCRDDRLAGHLRQLRDSVVARQSELDPEPVTEAQALVTEWAGIYQTSESTTTQKAAAEAKRRGARRELQWELYLNLLQLIKLYPRQPEKLREYMQLHWLRDKPRRQKEKPTETEAEESPDPTGSSPGPNPV